MPKLTKKQLDKEVMEVLESQAKPEKQGGALLRKVLEEAQRQPLPAMKR